MSRAKLSAARELIEEKKYAEARALLMTIRDDPTAAKWLAKLDERIKQQAPPQNYTVLPPAPNSPAVWNESHRTRPYPEPVQPAPAPVESIGMAGVFRFVWGILLLLSFGWICYGVTTTAGLVGDQLKTTAAQTSEGFQAGTMIGGGLGLTFFLCTGLPLVLLFGVLYWRNGVAIRETKKHNQMIQAMRR